MKKTVLIITYYKSENYGAFLQAFAMQEFLRNNNVQAEIYGYNSKTAPILGFLYSLVKRSPKSSKESRIYHDNMASAVINEQVRLNISRRQSNYDLTILGSDEIWNVKNVSAAHDSFLFMKNKKSKMTISYAACSGNSNYKHVKLFPYAIKGIKELDAISVRDENTEQLVKACGRKDVVRVLDPTFIIDWNKFLPEGNFLESYVFVYTYGLSVLQGNEVIDFANSHNLKIVVTGSYCEWADYNPAPSPFEWIALIKNAEFVVTSTFHGTIFSIQMKKNFAVFNSQSPKIHSVLKELHFLDRRVTEWNTLKNLYCNTIDYTKKEDIIESRIIRSKNFVLSKLGKKTIVSKEEKSNERLNDILGKPCYIARHKNAAIRWNSRSGGAFTAISDLILNEGGVVYGAIINENFEIIHKRAETKNERDQMRGSKYVQSNLSVSLKNLKRDLLDNKLILFTGTPCQVDAVKRLGEVLKKTDNLLTVDFICHGVPSPKAWKDYLGQYNNVTEVDFRDKKNFGWGDHVETIIDNNKKIHSKVFAFLYYLDFINRPSCYECPYAQFEHFSDITIGDCWGVEILAQGFNTDDSGVSMIFSNSEKGKLYLSKVLKDMDVIEKSVRDMRQPVMKGDGMGVSFPNPRRSEFWKDYCEKGFEFVVAKYQPVGLKQKIKETLRVPHSIRFFIKKLLRRN